MWFYLASNEYLRFVDASVGQTSGKEGATASRSIQMRRMSSECFHESNRLVGRNTTEDNPAPVGLVPKTIRSDCALARQVNRARHLRVRGCESCHRSIGTSVVGACRATGDVSVRVHTVKALQAHKKCVWRGVRIRSPRGVGLVHRVTLSLSWEKVKHPSHQPRIKPARNWRVRDRSPHRGDCGSHCCRWLHGQRGRKATKL